MKAWSSKTYLNLFPLQKDLKIFERRIKEEDSKAIYYRDPNIIIHLVQSKHWIDDEEVIEVDLVNVVATKPQVCKTLVRSLKTQTIPLFTYDAKKKKKTA